MLSASRWGAQQRLLPSLLALAQTAAQGGSCWTEVSGIVIRAPDELYWSTAGVTAAAAPAAAAGQWRRLLSSDSSSGGRESSLASQPRRPDGRGAADEEEQQQNLQDWLQREQGLEPAEAQLYAPQLGRAYGGDEAAALAGLPATFAWCRSQGLTGLQTAAVMDVIAKKQRDNVVRFAGTAQRDWELLDSYIREHVQATAGGKARKHICLADVLGGDVGAARALAMAPGHVTEWLAAVGQRLTRAQLGPLLAQQPMIVASKPATALAAMDWAVSDLGVTNQMAFFGRAPTLLNYGVEVLQGNWGSLVGSLQSAGLTVEQAKELVLKQPSMLYNTPDTLQRAVGWLHKLFPEPGRLWHVLRRGSHLLSRPAERLRHHADCLQERLGWDSKRVSAFIRDYPQPFATVNFSKPDTSAKLLFLTEVVGVASVGECIGCHSSYLMSSLQKMAAVYVLVLERAPLLLWGANIKWIKDKQGVLKGCGMSAEEYNAYLRAWRASEEGQRLLAELRAGRTDSWPRPPPLTGASGGSGDAASSGSPGSSSGGPGSSSGGG